mmetsp:Transcript_118075/g.241383  ORF Transcript_118075/g.241383 Transcript_118075/m.241383 type:complete len:211 (+) Transcript_118075:85-717(+)
MLFSARILVSIAAATAVVVATPAPDSGILREPEPVEECEAEEVGFGDLLLLQTHLRLSSHGAERLVPREPRPPATTAQQPAAVAAMGGLAGELLALAVEPGALADEASGPSAAPSLTKPSKVAGLSQLTVLLAEAARAPLGAARHARGLFGELTGRARFLVVFLAAMVLFTWITLFCVCMYTCLSPPSEAPVEKSAGRDPGASASSTGVP